MMLFVPIGQDREIRRWPVITVILITIMTGIQIYNELTARRAEQRYLIIKARYDKLFDGYRAEYHRIHGPKADLSNWRETVKRLNDFSQTQDDLTLQALKDGELIDKNSEEYQSWVNIQNAYNRAQHRLILHRFGFIPSHPEPWTWITSIFLHANMLHFLGNLIFFWFVGCNMEDRWGRWFYLVFFLTGGIAANYAHMLSAPYSSEPAIGASGAISALMGAMLIRFPKLPTRIFWIWFGFSFRHGVITIPAYVGLGLWFSIQLVMMSFGIGHIAYWAHIGGFLFGAGVAALTMLTGVDRRLDQSVEKKVDSMSSVLEYEANPLLSGALKLESRGRLAPAAELLRKALKSQPENQEIRERLGLILLKMNNVRPGTLMLAECMLKDAQNGEISASLILMKQIIKADGVRHIPSDALKEFILLLEKNGHPDEAESIRFLRDAQY